MSYLLSGVSLTLLYSTNCALMKGRKNKQVVLSDVKLSKSGEARSYPKRVSQVHPLYGYYRCATPTKHPEVDSGGDVL